MALFILLKVQRALSLYKSVDTTPAIPLGMECQEVAGSCLMSGERGKSHVYLLKNHDNYAMINVYQMRDDSRTKTRKHTSLDRLGE